MNRITFNFNSVVLVKNRHGQDSLFLECKDAPSPFPELEKQEPGSYPLSLKLECRKGYAEEWCLLMGIKIDKIVNIV